MLFSELFGGLFIQLILALLQSFIGGAFGGF
jgi:hypothetical protein